MSRPFIDKSAYWTGAVFFTLMGFAVGLGVGRWIGPGAVVIAPKQLSYCVIPDGGAE